MKTTNYTLLLIIISILIYFSYSPASASTSSAFKAYSSSCTVCHKLRNPKKYSRKVWSFHVKRMSKRAKITSSQKHTIIHLWDAKGISQKVKRWNKKNR